MIVLLTVILCAVMTVVKATIKKKKPSVQDLSNSFRLRIRQVIKDAVESNFIANHNYTESDRVYYVPKREVETCDTELDEWTLYHYFYKLASNILEKYPHIGSELSAHPHSLSVLLQLRSHSRSLLRARVKDINNVLHALVQILEDIVEDAAIAVGISGACSLCICLMCPRIRYLLNEGGMPRTAEATRAFDNAFGVIVSL
eukprot:g2637.t1